MKEKLIQSRTQLLENIKKVYQDKYDLGFLSGSLSGDRSDALSDIDVWLVVDESKLDNLMENRFDHFKQVGEIAHLCEPPQHSPVQGISSTVIYKHGDILTEVDYYLSSTQTAKFIENAKILFGEVNIPQGQGFPENATEHRPINETFRVDFLLMLLFISVKKTYRNDKKYSDMFSGHYHKLKTDYGFDNFPEIKNNYDFATLREYIKAIEPETNEKQRRFLGEIEAFMEKVVNEL